DGAVEAAFEHRADEAAGGALRVDVDGHVQRLCRGEDVPELRVIQILVVRVRVDHGAFEAKFRDGPLQFLRGFLRILWGDRGDAGEARGMFPDGLGELVVAGFGERDRGGFVENLYAGAGEGKDVHVQPTGIHIPDAPLIEPLQLFDDGAGSLG